MNQYHVQSWNQSNFPRTIHAELVGYRNGLQDQARYKRGVNTLINNNKRTVQGTSFRNLKLLDRYIRAVNGKLNRLELDPKVKQIDAFANEYKEMYDANIKAAMFLKERGINHDQILQRLQLTPDELPLNDDERKLMLMMNPRIEEEMEMEVAIGGVLESNDMNIIRKQVRLDWLILGIGGYRVETKNGRKHIRRLDPMCSGTSICTTENFSDIRFAYEIIARTPDEIRMMGQDQITEKDYAEIMAAAGTQNPNTTLGGGFYPLQGQLQNKINGQKFNNIVDFEIISVCDLDVDVKVRKDGGLAVYYPENGKEPTVDRPDRVVTKSKVQKVYTGKYVIGTNVIFDWGEKYNQTRQTVPGQADSYDSPLGRIDYTDEMYAMDELLTDPAKCLMGFKFYQPGLAYGASISMAQLLLTNLDALQLTWNNFYNTLVTWVGRGISIDLDQIVNMELGGKKIGEAELIDLLLTKNISLYRSSAMSKLHNARAGQGALEFKDDPADIKMQGLLAAFTTQLSILREISGLNSLDIAGAPNPDVGLGVSQIAAQGTDNMLEDIQFADRETFKAVCEHLMYDIKAYGAAGSYKAKPFIINPKLHSSKIYNLTVEARPSQEEKAALYERVARYAEQVADENLLLEVQSCESITQARMIFAAKQKRRKIEEAAIAKTNADYNIESQQASAKGKAEGDKNLQAQKSADELAKISAQGRIDLAQIVVSEGLKNGKSVEEIAKLMALVNLSPNVIPLQPEVPAIEPMLPQGEVPPEEEILEEQQYA